MRISEKALISELNKALRKHHKDQFRSRRLPQEDIQEPPVIDGQFADEKKFADDTLDHQERDILRIMINYHDAVFTLEDKEEGDKEEPESFNVLEFLLDEIEEDQLLFENDDYRKLFQLISEHMDEHDQFHPNSFINHEDEFVRNLFVDLMTFPYSLDNWEKKDIIVTDEAHKLRRAVLESIYAYKSKRVERMIKANQEALKNLSSPEDDPTPFLQKQLKLEQIKRDINQTLGRTVLH